jgi:hypothetical protein
MFSVEQIREIKEAFTDLGEVLKESASYNKELFEDTRNSIKELKELTGSVSGSSLAKDAKLSFIEVKEYMNKISDSILIMTGKMDDFMEIGDVTKALTGKVEEFNQELQKAREKGSKKTSKKKKGSLDRPKRARKTKFQKFMSDFKGSQLGGMASKAMIPMPGGILSGIMGIMMYGFQDKDRVRAEAGEVLNILVTATDAGTKGVVNKATRSLSSIQESLSRFYGIHRNEIQGVAKEFTEGGVRVSDMTRTVSYDVKGVKDDFITLSLAMDKFLEVPGGTSAQKAVSYVADYGKSFEDANEAVLKMVSAGMESGIGIKTFMENIDSTRDDLVKMGYDIETVINLNMTLQKSFEDLGVPKQFAGQQALKGIQQLTSGMSNMSEGAALVAATAMGYESNIKGLNEYRSSWIRVMKGNNQEEQIDQIVKVTEVALKASKGNEHEARRGLETIFNLGFEGANAAMEIYKAVKSGNMQEANKVIGKNLNLVLDGLKTEKAKASQFQLHFNEWLKGMSEIGQGVLGMFGKSLAMIVAYVRAIPAMFENFFTGNGDKNIDLMNKIMSFGSGIKDDLNMAKEGFSKLGDSATKMGADILGSTFDNLVAAFTQDIDKGYKPKESIAEKIKPPPVIRVPMIIPAESRAAKEMDSGSGFSDFGGIGDFGEREEYGQSISDDFNVPQGMQFVFYRTDEEGNIHGELVPISVTSGTKEFNISGNVANAIDYSSKFGYGGYKPGKTFDPSKYSYTEGDVDALARTMTSETSYGKGGRVGGQFEQEATAAGWTVLNRLNDKIERGKATPGDVKGIVTGDGEYGSLISDKKVVRPYHTTQKANPASLDLARRMLGGKVGDPTHGANFFWHSDVNEKGAPTKWGSPWAKAKGKDMAISLQLPSASYNKMLYVYDKKKGLDD